MRKAGVKGGGRAGTRCFGQRPHGAETACGCCVRPCRQQNDGRHDPCFNGNPRTSELGQVASLREARSVNSSRRWARGVSTDSPPRGINAQRRVGKPACWLEGPPTLSQRPSSEKILKHLRVCKIQLVYASAVQLKNDRFRPLYGTPTPLRYYFFFDVHTYIHNTCM